MYVKEIESFDDFVVNTINMEITEQLENDEFEDFEVLCERNEESMEDIGRGIVDGFEHGKLIKKGTREIKIQVENMLFKIIKEEEGENERYKIRKI